MLNCFERQYAELVKDVLDNGAVRQTRNAVTRSVFGRTLRFQPQPLEFPLLMGRKMFYRGVLGELAALLRGPKHIDDFKKQGCNYWDKWADPDGNIEVDYGNAWRDFNGFDQLHALVQGLRHDPYGRRHIVTGWRPDRLSKLSLPCCHMLYQWYVRDADDGERYLDMMWYQRSVDTMIGLPSDVVLAYTWNLLVANDVGVLPGEVVMNLGDTHVYEQHFEKAYEYLEAVERVDNGVDFTRPAHGKCEQGMEDFDPAQFQVHFYAPMPKIDFELIA